MTDARPPLTVILTSLLRADLVVVVKRRRSVVLSILLPIGLLVLTNQGASATARYGGALFLIGLCIAYGLVSTSVMGYALTMARDREAGVFQRLRVTPRPTWAIMASRLDKHKRSRT